MPLVPGDQVVRLPDPLGPPFPRHLRGVVLASESNGVELVAQVRWQDGSQERLPVVRLQKVQESSMRDQARKLIQEVAAGASPMQVVQGLSRPPIQEDVRPGSGEHPGAEIPPNAEDPSDSYKTSFDDGGNGPHAHVVTLDPQGNGLTDEEMGSQHQVLRFQVQPDPLDGHLHTLDLGVNRGVPSSRNPAGQPTTYHATSDDPHRSEGY